MSGFLLDTNVISETRKDLPDERVLHFLQGLRSRDFYTSSIVFAELRVGAERRAITHPQEGNQISQWIDGLEKRFKRRILVVDARVAAVYAKLQMHRDRPIMDTLLGATAVANGLIMVTRNTRDFVSMDVEVLNPWQ